MWKTPLENSILVALLLPSTEEDVWVKTQHSKLCDALPVYSCGTHCRKSAFWVPSYLQSISTQHPPIPGQGGAKDAVGKRERASDLWKAENYSPHISLTALFCGGESWIINYPMRWSWREHHCSLLSFSFTFHHHFSNPIDFYFSFSLRSSISTSNISQCQRVCFGRLSFTRPKQTYP